MKAPSYRNRIVFCMAILSLMTAVSTVLAGCGSGKKGYHPPESSSVRQNTDVVHIVV